MGQKQGFFLIYWKILSLIFTEFVLEWKYILFAMFLHNSGSQDMDQNVLSQSDYKSFNQPYLQNKSMK